MAGRWSLWAAGTKTDTPPRICSGNISTALYPESAEWFRRKTDYLYRSEELRVCVSTSIREAIMGHAWNVMVSASPPLRIKQTKFTPSWLLFLLEELQVMTTVGRRQDQYMGSLGWRQPCGVHNKAEWQADVKSHLHQLQWHKNGWVNPLLMEN